MPKKILVIEDEENLGQLIQAYLEQHGFTVSHVRDGEAAMAFLKKEEPDLILMDLLLPKLHGFELCKQIRQNERLKDIHIIIMTAVYKTAMDKMEAKRFGVHIFIEKPVEFSQLLKSINHTLGIKPETLPEMEGEMELKMEKLQQSYAEQLPDKIDNIEKLWSSILHFGYDRTRMSELRRQIHSLAGSGKTFGFEDITNSARELESLVDVILAEGNSGMESLREKINMMMDNLRHHPVVATGRQMKQMKI